MKKREFLSVLQTELDNLPPNELKEQLAFYGEMIDDGIEEGLTEDEAVAKIGSVSNILSQINRPSTRPIKKPTAVKGKDTGKSKAFVVMLLIMASPIWISLLAVLGALLVSALAVIWSLWISFIAVEIAFAASGLYGAVALIVSAINGEWQIGMGVFGGGLILSGFSLLIWTPCKKSVKFAWFLTKKIFGIVYSLLNGKRK